MSEAEPRDEAVFEAALHLTTEQRAVYLGQACAEDAELRRRVENLLDAFERAGGFLNEPAILTPARSMDSLAPSEKPGDRIGRYKLIEQIGEGGCGLVYVAEQEEPLRRRVALKVIKLGMDTRQVIARFDAERQALALMDHPNIAKVLDAGATATGRPFFVMELVCGVRITDFCDQHELPPRERLSLFIQVCRAIQHAHQKGIIHRDIKPSNILVTVNDGVPVPKVIDFGIAKATQGRLTNQTVYTAFEQFMGTPAYMSPEQAVMTNLDIDTRSDIYSLGVLLYELLTGSTPFDTTQLLAAGLDEIRRTIQATEPARPSTRLSRLASKELTAMAKRRGLEPPRLLHVLRGDLDWIVMKCLEKNRARRYETANGLATDVQRHLNCQPVVARPPSRFYEFQKSVRRHKFGFGAMAALIMVLAAAAIISAQALRHANADRKLLEAAQGQTRQQLYTALLEQARASVRSGDLGQRVRTLNAVQRAAAITNSAELRTEALAALALPDLRFERTISTGPDYFVVSLDPNFERLARAPKDGPFELRSTLDDRLFGTASPPTAGSIEFTKRSRDGRFFGVWRDSGRAGVKLSFEVWETATGLPLLVATNVGYRAVAFHPLLPRCLAGGSEGTLALWDFQKQEQLAQWPASSWGPAAPGDRPANFSLTALVFSPDGESFATACAEGPNSVVSVHRSVDGSLLASLTLSNHVSDMDWQPSGQWLGATDLSGWVQLIDPLSGQHHTLGRHKAEAATATFSPDGRYFFSGGWERELICWDMRSLERAFSVALDGFQIQFSADGRQCAVISMAACQIHSFELPSAERELPENLQGKFSHAAFSPNGRWLAVSDQTRMGVWDLASPGPCASTTEGAGTRLFFSANGDLFASSDDGSSRWHLTPAESAGHQPILTKLGLPNLDEVVSICPVSNSVVLTSPKGSQLARLEASEAGKSRWFPTATGVNGASPDGQWLAIFAPFTPYLHVYHLPDFKPIARLTNQFNIWTFEFAPGGGEVAVASPGRVEFWSTAIWQRTGEVTNAMDLIYEPHQPGWWLKSDFRSGGLYASRSRKPLLPLPIGSLPLAVSADGQHLAVSVDARRLQVWDLAEVRRRFRELGIDWKEN